MKRSNQLTCSWIVIGCAACTGAGENPAELSRSSATQMVSDAKTDLEPGLPWEDELAPDVLATMRRQEALEPVVTALYEAYLAEPGSGFAGIAFEDDGVALYYKDALTPVMNAAVGQVKQLGHIKLKSAAFSLSELQAAGAAIEAAEGEPGSTDIQSIGYRSDGSGLDIELVPPAAVADWNTKRVQNGRSALQSAKQLVAGLGLPVPVTFSTAAELVRLRSRLADTAPWNGGDRYTMRTTHGTNVGCTTGFGVNASGRTWILTAAHCGSFGDVAFQGLFPAAQNRRMGPVHDDQWRYDLLLIDTSGWSVIFDGPPDTSRVKYVNSWGYHAKDQLVCQSGATSGTICALKTGDSMDISFSREHPDSDGDYGYRIIGEIKTVHTAGSVAGRSGDSGGPVFTLDGAGVKAKGIVSASDGGSAMYFQDWADVIRLFGAFPRTN